MQHLIIGDIHGCFDELQDLLQAAGLASDDQIIALGDIVDRGPDCQVENLRSVEKRYWR
ncbi:MAG: hypothetical protein EA424_23705 [Planctomycetaceae bacterium]|nr:MAG: hypothetical protein EA424_23705 [Planctomycetaceae bacterium]